MGIVFISTMIAIAFVFCIRGVLSKMLQKWGDMKFVSYPFCVYEA